MRDSVWEAGVTLSRSSCDNSESAGSLGGAGRGRQHGRQNEHRS